MARLPQQRGGTLLPWEQTGEEVVRPAGGGSSAPPPLSLVDCLAAPTFFMHQTFVFGQPLCADKLWAALAQALAAFPTLACRAVQDEVRRGGSCAGRCWCACSIILLVSPPASLPQPPQAGEWQLCQPHAGALLTVGTSATPLRRLAPQAPLPPAAPLVNLGTELFGHLEGASLAADALPLLQVALVELHGGGGGGGGTSSGSGSDSNGGCVLGLRASHLVADFGTLRGLLHHLAAAYSGRQPAGGTPQPVEPLVAALAVQPPPAGSQPWNYLRWPPSFMEQLMALAAAPAQHGLTLHFPPARLAALKTKAAAEAAAAAAAEGGGGSEPAWVSTNDALMAWLWKAFASLPCRWAGGRGGDARLVAGPPA